MFSRLHRALACLGLVVFLASSLALAEEKSKTIRLGMIGLDTSHAAAFAKVLNNPDAEGPLAGIKLVAAFPECSPDLPSSYERVDGYTETLRAMGIEIVDSIDELLKKVDGVLIESVDGRPHLRQARPVIAAGKPVWIDKPLAGSLADGMEIVRLAKEANVPCFSASSMRYAEGVVAVRNDPKIGEVEGCMTYSPCSLDPHHPDLFWYGIHGVEALFTIMGPGCVTVSRVQTENTDLVTGVWNDGRVGTFRGKRAGTRGYGGLVFGTKAIVPTGGHTGYEALVVEIAMFFKTGKAPIRAEETIEILAFMEAADESKRQGGGPVTIESVMAKARRINAERK